MMKLSNNEKDENPVAESPRRASILRRLVVGYSSRPGSFEMDLSDAKRLKQLEEENAKLKRLLADAMLDNVVLKDLLGKP